MDYASQNGLILSVKTGKNYPCNLRSPSNPRLLITDLDGSYILSNDEKNAKIANVQISKQFYTVNDRLKKAQTIINHYATNTYRRSQELVQVKRLLKNDTSTLPAKLGSLMSDRERDIDKLRESLVMEHDETRYIAIVEAKGCLSKGNIDEQSEKMMNLIDFFRQCNWYYNCKSRGILENAISRERWSTAFCKMCDMFNMRFNGIVLVIGGPYYQKNIVDIFGKMKGEFKTELSKEIANLIRVQDENSRSGEGASYYAMRDEFTLKFISNIHLQFELVFPNGSRFGREGVVWPIASK
jgi:hypothetical protein